MKKNIYLVLFLLPLVISAQNVFEFNVGADFVSRYVWRGMDFGSAPSTQPTLSMGIDGLEIGFWGSYALSNNAQTADELDTYLSYSIDINNEFSVSAIVTDYYFPSNGIKIGNFNNYNNVNGPGAHTIEAGLAFTGSELFPLTISAFMNVYNDEGKNSYFQIDYPFTVHNVDLDLFIGATAGSKENPNYYNSATFNIINIGLTALRKITITNEYSLPIFASYILNPKLEVSYLVLGISL